MRNMLSALEYLSQFLTIIIIKVANFTSASKPICQKRSFFSKWPFFEERMRDKERENLCLAVITFPQCRRRVDPGGGVTTRMALKGTLVYLLRVENHILVQWRVFDFKFHSCYRLWYLFGFVFKISHKQTSYVNNLTLLRAFYFTRLFRSAKIRPHSEWSVLYQPRRYRTLQCLL